MLPQSGTKIERQGQYLLNHTFDYAQGRLFGRQQKKAISPPRRVYDIQPPPSNGQERLVIDRDGCVAYRFGTMQRNRFIIVPGFTVLLLFASGLEATTVIDPGTKKHSVDIDWNGHKGRIDVHEGVTYAEEGTQYVKGISLGYSGKKSGKCHWIQFVWREILVTKRGEPAKAKSGTVDTTGGSLELTTDSASPNYIVDSDSKSDPSFESGVSMIRDRKSITLFDSPASAILLTKDEQADPKTEKIEAKTHLETFLACKGKICAKVAWTSTYAWTKEEGEKGPLFTIDAPDRSGTLNQAEKDKLKEKYPHQRKLKG